MHSCLSSSRQSWMLLLLWLLGRLISLVPRSFFLEEFSTLSSNSKSSLLLHCKAAYKRLIFIRGFLHIFKVSHWWFLVKSWSKHISPFALSNRSKSSGITEIHSHCPIGVPNIRKPIL
ncbi:hypothetical protein DFJ73DRAFT_861860 [Zopfochytrium polystomum]|nr:hypothetical protein DFJ73DRAFT_861860 [Zopfochytrium polystomum]